MLGSLGAVTATAPAEHLLAWMDWRQLFEILAVATGAAAILIYVVVPERIIIPSTASIPAALSSVFGDRRFWRIQGSRLRQSLQTGAPCYKGAGSRVGGSRQPRSD